jgi:hypothetical protein
MYIKWSYSNGIIVLVISFCLIFFDVGTLPAYIPQYHRYIDNIDNVLNTASCDKYLWDKLVEVDFIHHFQDGGLTEKKLRLTLDKWRNSIFHFQYLNGQWYISNTPLGKCKKEGRVCWGRSLSFLEDLILITKHGMLKESVQKNNVLDVLYSPWDEPLNISTYPVLQYNRGLNDFGMIIPYHYAFNHGQLDDYIVRRNRYRKMFLRPHKWKHENNQHSPYNNVLHTLQKRLNKFEDVYAIRELERCKQNFNHKRRNVAVFRGSATYANTFATSSRGILCNILDKEPKLQMCLDVGIISGEADGTYCGRTHERLSLRQQAACYTMILDIEGQSYFTDRTTQLLLLNTTIIRQERQGADFLTPYFIQPWKHYVPVKYDFSNIQEQIDWMKSKKNVKKINEIRENAMREGLFRTSAESIECAVWKNIDTLIKLKKYKGFFTTSKESRSNEDLTTQPLLIEPAYVFRTLIWERPGNGDWRLFINIPGKPRQIYVGIFLLLLNIMIYYCVCSGKLTSDEAKWKSRKYN